MKRFVCASGSCFDAAHTDVWVVRQVSVNSYVRGSGAVGGAISGVAAAALQKQVATLKAELAALKKEVGAGGGISINTATLTAGDGGGANVALMAERLTRLEIDKARLLDRLEVRFRLFVWLGLGRARTTFT